MKNLEVNDAETHKTEGEAGHDAGEEDEKTGETGVDEPPEGSKGYGFGVVLNYRIHHMHRVVRLLDCLLLLRRLDLEGCEEKLEKHVW